MHVQEDKNAVPGFVGHEVDERLDSACFEIGFGVGVGVVADGVADAPNYVAKATEIENISPHAVIAVEKIVPDTHKCVHHQPRGEREQEASLRYRHGPK